MKKPIVIFLTSIFILVLSSFFIDSAVAETCSSFTYSDWTACASNGQQTRTVILSSPDSCTDGNPVLTQSCSYTPDIPVCGPNDYSCGPWGACEFYSNQTRTCDKISNCQGGAWPSISQFCSYVPKCTGTASNWFCSNWNSCTSNGTKSRNCYQILNCDDGTRSPETTQPCTYNTCISLYYSSWSECSSDGKQTRSISSKYPLNCEGGELPELTQSCSYTPVCSTDTWQCGDWGTCSPQGIQARSCNKTFDCPSVETASPASSQYCVAPNQPQLQSPTEDLGIVNQASIIKSTVKLICPVNETTASQGSGTVIDSSGTILTNDHVVDGTVGCLVGFVDNYGDEPYFGDRQIADIYRVSKNPDIAILKLRNPTNKKLAFINIATGNSNQLNLGNTITTYGYPASFGTKITYTSGDFSGVDGNYLKTTAIIEHGNSGGGAYLKNGTFIGIPSAVVKGSLNSMGYLLSVNTVNSWLNNSSLAYSSNNNSYSRVSSVLDDIDLNTLGSLNLFIADNSGTAQNNSTTDNKNIDKNLSKKLSGKLLLQVERGGAIWYVDTKEYKRYSVTFANALPLFKKLSLGITNADLAKIPVAKTGQTGSSVMGNRLKGKLLLQTEQGGAIWYVDQSGYRHLVTWDNLLALFKSLSLGITNVNLEKISEGSL